ncbi:MAG: hypothetical protein U1F68_20940 [Gammaproteobacteria bacterium]
MARPPGTESPAIKALAGVLRKELPGINFTTWRAGSMQGGVMKPDRHTAGLAIDIMLDSRDDDEKDVADALIDAFIKHHSSMQWYDMIYVDWKDEDTPFYFHIPGKVPLYGGKLLEKTPTTLDAGLAHRNHIHLDWCDYKDVASDPADVYNWPSESKKVTFVEDLRKEFQLIDLLFATQATPGWLRGWWEFKWRGSIYYYYFDTTSHVAWSQTKPQDRSVPMQHEEGRGTVAIGAPPNGITILWRNSGSKEEFTRVSGAKIETLTGFWNGTEPIDGTKMR